MTGRRGAVLGLAVLVIVGCSTPVPDGDRAPQHSRHPAQRPPGESHPEPDDADAYARSIVDETNAVRSAADLPALEHDDCATDAAARRAALLVGAPDLEHAPLDDVIATCDPPQGSAAENLSRAAAPPSEVVTAWEQSPGHRANLLDPTLTSIGVSCVVDDVEGEAQMLCSQVFLG